MTPEQSATLQTAVLALVAADVCIVDLVLSGHTQSENMHKVLARYIHNAHRALQEQPGIEPEYMDCLRMAVEGMDALDGGF